MCRAFNSRSNYKVEIQRNLINDINNFGSVNSNKGKQTGFRKIKNHLSTGVFMMEKNSEDQQNLQPQINQEEDINNEPNFAQDNREMNEDDNIEQ